MNTKNITTDFEKFKDKQLKKFDKEKVYPELSNDIVIMSKLDSGEFKKVDGEVSITKITGVVNDPEEIKEIEKAVKENYTLDTSITLKDVKRGDIFYLTCLLEKSKTASWNSQTMGVVKVRVVDFYYGLNKLKTLK